MLSEDQVAAAIEDFCKDPTWAKIFLKAPPGAMKRLSIAFFYANNLVEKKNSQEQADIDLLNEYRALREEVEANLDIEDLEYLAANMKKEKRPYYEKLLNQKRKEMEKESGNGGTEQNGAAA